MGLMGESIVASGVIGHDRIKKLVPDLDAVTLPMLFLGPDGVGKRTYAEWLARDLHSLSKRILLNPSIDDVRALLGWALKRSLVKQLKVAIIEVSNASLEAQNALLKLVEEPPTTLRVILISNHERVLPTIRSRCLRYTFTGLARQELLDVLLQEGYAQSLAQVAVDYADGSISQAISYMNREEQVFAIDSLLRLSSPADQAERLLKFSRSEGDFQLLSNELARSAKITTTMLGILARPAGIRARALLSLMMRPDG